MSKRIKGIHSFADLPILFGGEPSMEEPMGFTRKNTAERLDKLIQFIYHYQTENNGDTPKSSVIANELGTHESGTGYFIKLLINDNRLEKISSRPFRVRILGHPKNRAAIRRLEKALAAAAALEAGKVPTPEPEKQPLDELLPEPGQFTSEASTEQRVPEPAPAIAHLPYPRPRTLYEAEQNLKSVGVDPSTTSGKDVITLPTIKTAPTGMLLEELLNRGYTVSKNR